MSSPERRRRALHKLAVSAAAVAVCVLPTACDYPLASPPGAPTAPVDGQPGTEATTAPVVVPVGNITTERSSRGDRDRDRRFRTRTARPTTSAPSPAGAPQVTDTVVPPATDTAVPSATDTNVTTTVDPGVTTDPAATTVAPPVSTTIETPTNGPLNGNNGLEVLGRDCTASELPPHSGFQDTVAKCVSTSMGEVAAQEQLPSLLITEAPTEVGVGQPFMLKVATRNLVRDRFLGAAAGGYYLESSFLNGEGLQRGHFHTACRILPNTDEAPDSSGVPAFFLATQDNGGGRGSDTVSIEVPATSTATAGTMQCTSWAGDGSHRTPMMSKANQTPAIDSVRIQISGNAPAAPIDQADVQADAAQQQQAQQQEAAEQAPDQDGAPQPGAEESAPGGAPATAPAPAGTDTAAPEAPAASTSATATPASRGSLQDRFRQARERQAQGDN